jgi:nucleoside-diphosphate kinase
MRHWHGLTADLFDYQTRRNEAKPHRCHQCQDRGGRFAHHREQAETFYAVHKARPFFAELVSSMISGPVIVQVLEGEGAIAKYREIMGATDPKDAAKGTIRQEFALSVGENSVHGSDAPETAKQEIAQFFATNEWVR